MADLFGDDESDNSIDIGDDTETLGGKGGDGTLLFEIPLLKSFEGEQGMGVASRRAMISKLAKEGYIEGKSEQEKVEMQEGFDEGFERGQKLGRLCGRIYGEIRAKHSEVLLSSINEGDSAKDKLDTINDVLQNLEKLFFYDFPQCLKSRSMEQDAGEHLYALYGDKVRSYFQILSEGVDGEESVEAFIHDLKQIR